MRVEDYPDSNPECGYCSPFGHEPTCPGTFTDHILATLEEKDHRHPLVAGYCLECQRQVQPRFYRAALIVSDEGQAITEYAVLLGFITLMVLAAVMQVGNAVYNVFNRVGSHVFGHIR
jgi:Flp pilus assembly pilin Flp